MSDIVKRLRKAANDPYIVSTVVRNGVRHREIGCEKKLLLEAADVIEEMTKENQKRRECLVEAEQDIEGLTPNNGNWIKGEMWSEGCGMGEYYGYFYKCSVCRKTVKGDYKKCGMKYCPNCGARMGL